METIAETVVKECTDEWVECFSKPENQNGFMWRMVGIGILPEAVDPDDPRVIALCSKAKGG